MKTTYTQRSTHEAKTHELFDIHVYSNEDKWSPNRAIVASVLRAHYSLSLSKARIEAIACALHGYEKLDLQKELTALCREKCLRSRVVSGTRLYEVNY